MEQREGEERQVCGKQNLQRKSKIEWKRWRLVKVVRQLCSLTWKVTLVSQQL